jgi:hypothetical protein
MGSAEATDVEGPLRVGSGQSCTSVFSQKRTFSNKLRKQRKMSFDIIVLKPTDVSVDDISDVADVVPIGNVDDVSAAFDSVFPNCLQGVFIDGEDYSVEGFVSGNPVQSVHLALRSGGQSSGDTTTIFLAGLADLCRRLNAVAFAVSDNSRLAP